MGAFTVGGPVFPRQLCGLLSRAGGDGTGSRGDSAGVYKFLGQGEVTAVEAVVSKGWTRDCSISALRSFFLCGGGERSGECRFLWCMHLRGKGYGSDLG